MANGGVCSRCLGLPYCRSCKRHLSSNCFDDPNVCQVQFIPSSCHFNVLGTTHKTTGSYRFIPTTVFWFQACSRKRRRPRFTRAIDNIVNEVQLPTSPEDTSFHHFLHRNAEIIDKIVCEHVERHGYISCTDNSFFPFLLSPSYNQTQIAVVLCLCLTDLYVS